MVSNTTLKINFDPLIKFFKPTTERNLSSQECFRVQSSLLKYFI